MIESLVGDDGKLCGCGWVCVWGGGGGGQVVERWGVGNAESCMGGEMIESWSGGGASGGEWGIKASWVGG